MPPTSWFGNITAYQFSESWVGFSFIIIWDGHLNGNLDMREHSETLLLGRPSIQSAFCCNCKSPFLWGANLQESQSMCFRTSQWDRSTFVALSGKRSLLSPKRMGASLLLAVVRGEAVEEWASPSQWQNLKPEAWYYHLSPGVLKIYPLDIWAN